MNDATILVRVENVIVWRFITVESWELEKHACQRVDSAVPSIPAVNHTISANDVFNSK